MTDPREFIDAAKFVALTALSSGCFCLIVCYIYRPNWLFFLAVTFVAVGIVILEIIQIAALATL